MNLAGFHHLTAVTADPSTNHAFYTETLGMRLVKKTVNQDDVSAYHLFYGDGVATPGSDLTFFAWPLPREGRGTRSIIRTGLRVTAGNGSLDWWGDRLRQAGCSPSPVVERDGRLVLDFEDPEGQRLSLVEDDGGGPVHPWGKSPVPPERQIRGLGPVTIGVPDLDATEGLLTGLLNMRRLREYAGEGSEAGRTVFAMGEGGASAELHVAVEGGQTARLGAGGVHHVAFRAPGLADYEGWIERLREKNIPSSGPVDRHYFKSLYFRDPSGILYEIATDEPGFTVDESLETLGETISLPPFLESRRAMIEAGLPPL